MKNTAFYDELAYHTFCLEGELTQSVKPLVIDVGSTYVDHWGATHTDACGWLSICVALQYAYYTKRVPKYLAKKLRADECSASKLKLMSGCTFTNVRMDRDDKQENVDKISKALDICIVVWEKNEPTCYNKSGTCRVDLWLSQGHYQVYIPDKSERPAVEAFCKLYGEPYKCKELTPVIDTQNDEAIARALNKLYNREDSNHEQEELDMVIAQSLVNY